MDFEGWHEDDDYLYIVMEHVKLGSLSKHYPPPPFHPEIVQDIAIQLCKGLRVMHSCGIAHRDLNPNVCRPQMRWCNYQGFVIQIYLQC